MNITDLESVACPTCGPARIQTFAKSDGFQIVRCMQCSLLFVSPRKRQESIARHYREDYINTVDRVMTDFSERRAVTLQREAMALTELLPNGGRLLDLGTASGEFLTHFAGKTGWQVEGIEPSTFAASFARSRLNVPIHNGLLGDAALPDSSFDIVTSLDAFFFHPNPNADLAEVSRILRPNGIFAIEIPSLQFRLLKNKGALCKLVYRSAVRLNAGAHLYFYSRATLAKLLRSHGFRLVKSLPEQGPVYGSLILRSLNHIYYRLTKAAYRFTRGRLALCPKEFLLFRKHTP